MNTADHLHPCDGSPADISPEISAPATRTARRSFSSTRANASRGLLAALPILASAASANNADTTEGNAARDSYRLPETLRARPAKPSAFATEMSLAPAMTQAPSSASTRHGRHEAALPEGVVRRPTTRATTPVFLGTPSTVEFDRTPLVRAGGKSFIQTLSSAKKAPGFSAPMPMLALPPMPVNSGKAILPSSSFSEARVAQAALRVLRPQSTQWLAQSGARGASKTVAQTSADATRGMQKVITVSALKIPPASQPLSPYLKARAVSADKFAAPQIDKARLAQNPNAAPIRPARPITNSDRLPNQLEVSAGTFVVLLTTTDLDTVAIADPNVADVAVINSRSVLVNGKAPGVTSLVIVDRNRIRQYQVRVSPAQGTRATDVAAAIGLPGVVVRPLRDALVLEGEVDSPEEARRAVEIAGVFSTKILNQLTVRGTPSDSAARAAQIQNTINLPNVTVRTVGDTVILDGRVENGAQKQRAQNVAAALGKTVLNLIELPTLTLDQVGQSIGILPTDSAADAVGMRIRQVGDQIILEGIAPNQAAIDQAQTTATRSGLQVINRLQLAAVIPADQVLLNSIQTAIGIPGVRVTGTPRRLVLQGTVADTNVGNTAEQIARGYSSEVDNMLVTPNPINVNVDVKLIEVNKNDLKNLGVTFTNFLDGAANPIGFVLSEPTRTGVPGLITDNAGDVRTRSPLQASIRAVIDNGRARLLSNPNTTVLSGRTATFQVGGQVPIPGQTTVTNSGSTTAIIFKDFGVLIDIVTSARLDGVVTMRVRTEVSQPDFTLGVTPPGGGSPIPGFARRSAVTEVTVQPGGTIALAGLLQNNARQLVRRVPLLSKIPVLGALFTSKRFQNDETELAIFVTPRVLPNPLTAGQVAPVAPIPSGNTVNVGTTTGNPGIATFNSGTIFTPAPAGGGGQ